MDVLAHSLNCDKTPAKAQMFADALYEAAAEIERDHAGRLEERLGAHRGEIMDAKTG